jgi:anaerobic magnesium-protoporphyrin IX monomethyl ester cyclase
MLPYEGTPIRDELERNGRLRGDICHPDYDFLDPRVTTLYSSLSQTLDVWGWIHGYRALSPQLNWAWNEVAIISRLFPYLPDFPEYQFKLRLITAASNASLFEIVDDLIACAKTGKRQKWTPSALDSMRCHFLDQLLRERDTFISRHQNTIMRALHPEAPVLEDALRI